MNDSELPPDWGKINGEAFHWCRACKSLEKQLAESQEREKELREEIESRQRKHELSATIHANRLQQLQQERNRVVKGAAISADRAYINGAVFGWNCGQSDDKVRLESSITSIQDQITEYIKAEQALAAKEAE